jgi:hypothetical protein
MMSKLKLSFKAIISMHVTMTMLLHCYLHCYLHPYLQSTCTATCTATCTITCTITCTHISTCATATSNLHLPPYLPTTHVQKKSSIIRGKIKCCFVTLFQTKLLH